MALDVVDLHGLHVFLPSSHIGMKKKKKPALKADALDLSMQNLAMLLF